MNAIRAITVVALLITSGASAPGAEAAPGTELGPPRIDLLKDAQICPDGQGNYYLTGTAATFDRSGRVDFDHNRGVPLWRSRDLKTWENLGFAWDRVEHFARSSGRPKLGVWLDWSAPADRIDGLLAQATTTPELCHIGDAWYIVCAMNGQNIVLQKSTSGKPEGPYEDYAYLATRGGDPSLFADDDGKVYLAFADAWVARVKPDLKELAEEPRPLLPQHDGPPGAGRLTLGDPGVALFKRGGKYCVLAARWQVRDGRAESRRGALDCRRALRSVPRNEPGVVRQWHGVGVCRRDRQVASSVQPAGRVADCGGSPAMKTTCWIGLLLLSAGSVTFAQKEEALKSRLQPLFDTPLRDTSICKGGDSAWYLTGTAPDFQNNDGIRLWRSTDCQTWKEIGRVWSIERQRSAWQKPYRVNPDNPSGPLVRGMVSPEIHFHRNTYWITYSMNAQGTGLLKSTTGRPEGPYEDLGQFTGQGTDASLFVDDDGTGYWLVGQGWLAKLKPDWSGLAEHPQLLRCAPFSAIPHGGHEMSSTNAPRYLGMAGAHLFKEDGEYYLIGAAGARPDRGGLLRHVRRLRRRRSPGRTASPHLMIAHGGQTTVFQGPDDRWWATFGGRDSRAIFQDRPAIRAAENSATRFNTEITLEHHFRANLARLTRSSAPGPK